jgi:hypothetical protein
MAASHSRGAVPTVITMAELLSKHGVDRVGFLKVDIEGSEFDLFAESANWLERVDRISMEVHARFGYPESICQVLAGGGFRLLRRTAAMERVDPLRSDGYVYGWR